MGQLDKHGILTLQELMITALATADVVARVLIDKGVVTKEEFDMKLFSERELSGSIAAVRGSIR
jgi:hypothetical protein